MKKSLRLFIFVLAGLGFADLTFSADGPCTFQKIGPIYSTSCLRPSPKSKTLIVYLHGVFQDARRWDTRIDDEYRKMGQPNPNVLTISFGPVVFLSPVLNLEKLSREVNDYAKNIALRIGVKNVHLLGESMGGANAIQLFSRHNSQFDRAAFMCPALSRISPFAPNRRWQAEIRATNASQVLAQLYRSAQIFFYLRPSAWAKDSPLAYLKGQNESSADKVPVFVAVAERDKYGFTKAVYELANQFDRLGYPTYLRSYAGADHCEIDYADLVRFFSEPIAAP